MMRTGKIKSLKVLAKILITSFSISLIGYGTNTFAENIIVKDNIEESASEGKIIVGVEGYDYSSDQKKILDKINEIRLEACKEGVPNPNNPSEKLTMDDYNPVKLGVNNTKAAKIRSVEGAARASHARPNGTSCDTVLRNLLGTSYGLVAENLTWREMNNSDLELWYSEKTAWVNKGSGQTGHYETLINPKINYCGIAAFNPINDERYTVSGWKLDWCCTAGSFSANDEELTVLESDKKELLIQKIEIDADKVTNITGKGNSILHAGENGNITLYVDFSYGAKISNCPVYDGVVWTSSDDSIVEINSSTGDMYAKNDGKVEITATIGAGASEQKKTFDLAVVPEGVEPVEAINPDVVTAESFKLPTLSNKVSVKLSDGTSIEVTPVWDSYDSKKTQTHFKSNEFDVKGKACGLDVVQKVHINAARITNIYPKESKGSSYVVVRSKTTDSGTPITYPGVGISLSNGYSWTYSGTWTTRSEEYYKKREGGTFTEKGYANVLTDDGYKKLETSFELTVNPATVKEIKYDDKTVEVSNGTNPVSVLPTTASVIWSNEDVDKNVKIIWNDVPLDNYNNSKGGEYTLKGTVDCGFAGKKEISIKYKVLSVSESKNTTATVQDVKNPEGIINDGSASYTVKKDGSLIYDGSVDKNTISVIVPDNVIINGKKYPVTEIKKGAFKGSKKLQKITIGSNVTTIGISTFEGCTSLKSIVIPKKVKKIGKKAFYGCKKLKTITIKTTKLKKSTIGSKAFKGIYKKAKFKCPKAKLKNYKKWLKKAGAPKKAKYKK